MTQFINSFTQGMDKDSSKNKYDNQHYYEANNIRIFTQEGSSAGALEDIIGTIKRIDISGAVHDSIIIGYCILRDDLILFITDNFTNFPSDISTDYIVRVSIEQLDALGGAVNSIPIDFANYHAIQDPDDGYNLIYTGNLRFCAGNPIKAIPRYENEYVQKIYWTDGYNNLRWINTVHNNDTNDLTTLPIDRLEIISNFKLTQPTISQVISGNITSGKIAYAYQLYMLNGSQTVISPVSEMFHVTKASDIEYDSRDYFGSHIDDNSGKGFKVSFDIDSQYYTRARVIAIHYTSLEDEPEIRIVEEFNISPNDTSATFTDIGESIGNLTLEELRILSTSLFVPKDIETKDNILFAGGVIEDSFDVDFDARTYRFAGTSVTPGEHNYATGSINGLSRLYEQDNIKYYQIVGSSKVLTGSGVSVPGGSDWEDMPEGADCINRFNNLEYDPDTNWSTRFRYQSDGITLGGEGPNVKFEFATTTIEIANMYDALPTWYILGQGLDGGSSNFSYRGYASPKYGGGSVVGYHRDEVYRFGIVFFDAKGRNSFVKWICDIRMPSVNTLDTQISGESFEIVSYDAGSDILSARVLRIDFSLTNNIPPEAVSYQIVRVKREEGDRSILGQGIVNRPYYDSPTDLYHRPWETAPTTTVDVYQFHSPEVAFNKNLTLNNGTDYLQSISIIDNTDIIDYNGTSTNLGITRYNDYISYSADNEVLPANFTDMDEGFIVKQDGIEYQISTYTYTIVNHPNDTEKGICFLVKADNFAWSPGNSNSYGRHLVNYRRNVHESRYGGITFNARKRSEYIIAGNIKDINDVTDTPVYGGDTYIGMFDCLYSSQQLGDVYQTNVGPEVVYIPCESSINLSLRRPSPYSHVFWDTNSHLIRDDAGTHIHTSAGDATYIQLEDYYAYNTVYSRENDVKIFISKPFDWNEIEKFDVRIKASLTKINGEFSDNWLSFPVNQFIDVDPQYGQLTALKMVNDKLLFFQEQAFGVLSVNERALIETQNVSQLSLGVAGLLDRYDYAKTNIGCYHWRHLTLTPDGLYWVDLLGRAVYRYSEGIEEISLTKGMDSWFKDNIYNKSSNIVYAMHVFHDPKYKEVYFIDTDNDWGIIYNELTKSFITFTDIQPNFVMNYFDRVLGYDTSAINDVHKHNDTYGQRGNFYNAWKNLYLTLLINPSQSDISIFNNFEWLTEVQIADVDQFETWNTIQMFNDYQSTSVITLIVNDNVKRRMRKWRYTIPRGIQNRQGTPLTGNERYARMRDSHLFTKFTYIPNQVDNKKIIIHDIITSHTISNK